LNGDYKLEDFERLRLRKVLKMPHIEREVDKFMSKNSLELEFSGDEHGEGISSQHEHLRISSFIILTL